MSSSSAPKIQVFFADGAITKGTSLKRGSDDGHVTPCTANTSKVIGIAQNTVTTAEDAVEVALPGGGGKALLGGSCAMGDLLVPHTDGSLKIIQAAGNRLAAKAMVAGVTGDLIGVEVIDGQAYAAE